MHNTGGKRGETRGLFRGVILVWNMIKLIMSSDKMSLFFKKTFFFHFSGKLTYDGMVAMSKFKVKPSINCF